MNSEAHDKCGEWIAQQFRGYGLEVIEQKAALKGWDGTTLNSTNIIAQLHPDTQPRLLLCAHWDSRPWADNDPDEQNHHTPVMAANDGASGVAVMLELARLLAQNDSLGYGIDFICFDAEDYGMPQWQGNDEDSWALGAQYWAAHPHKQDYKAGFGVLLDMVGGEGAVFCHERFSLDKAPSVVTQVWRAANVAGYSSIFADRLGGYVTDDHIPVNDIAGIPCIDIIPYYADCEASSFGPTWHTVNDDMAHIDRNTLKAVGQSLLQFILTIKQ